MLTIEEKNDVSARVNPAGVYNLKPFLFYVEHLEASEQRDMNLNAQINIVSSIWS